MEQPMNFFEDIFGKSADDGQTVFLGIGAQGPGILRDVAEIMKECTDRHFEKCVQRSEEILQYGCYTGSPSFKAELAKYLTERYRNPVQSEDLFIHSGSTQALTNLLNYYFNEGDTLFIADPTYFNFLSEAAKTFRLNIIGIGLDDDGIKVEEMVKHLESLPTRPPTTRYPFEAAVYVMPVHQNPTGVCLSPGRCHQLVKLAREHDLLVVADDVYNLLTFFPFNGEIESAIKPPTRLFCYDKKSDPDYKGNVVSIGTFSKILAPGLRTGWYEMPQRILGAFRGMYASGCAGACNPYIAGLLTVGLRSGLIQKHIAKTCAIYRRRLEGAHHIFMTELGQYGVRCRRPNGGNFLWVCLPKPLTAKGLLAACGGKVSFIPGEKSSVSGQYANCMRISVAYYEDEVLFAAVREICDSAKRMLN